MEVSEVVCGEESLPVKAHCQAQILLGLDFREIVSQILSGEHWDT